jgi:hypothetical protein
MIFGRGKGPGLPSRGEGNSYISKGDRGYQEGTSAKRDHARVFLRAKMDFRPWSDPKGDYYMSEARGPENLPPAPLKQCERKGRDVGVAVPPGCGRREPCWKAWLLFGFPGG